MCECCIHLNISIQYNSDFVYDSYFDFDFVYNFCIDIENHKWQHLWFVSLEIYML